MKVVVLALVLSFGSAQAFWFFGRNNERTATADGRAVDGTCTARAQTGECEFFNCFEQRLPCGREFYMQRYGSHYCNRFQSQLSSFTPAGQTFVRDAQRCLTQRLVNFYSRDYVNCHDLEHDAVAAVGSCYTEHGFCDIIGDNARQFLEVFQVNDLFSRGAGKLWREIMSLATHCGGQGLNSLTRAIASRLSPLRSLFNRDED